MLGFIHEESFEYDPTFSFQRSTENLIDMYHLERLEHTQQQQTENFGTLSVR